MVGTGVSVYGTPDALMSLICQMPFQCTPYFLFLKAMNSASGATVLGLQPCCTTSVIQVSAWTPASLSKVALVPSAAYGSPPCCQSRLRKIRCAGQRCGIQNGCWRPADLSLPRASSKPALSVGGESILAFLRSSEFQYDARECTSSG